MSNRYRVDRVAELGPGQRSIKHPEPVPVAAFKDDGYGPGRLPDGKTVHGPEYQQAMEREGKPRMCATCHDCPPRKPQALRCEACESVHRLALKRASDAKRRQQKRAKKARDGEGAI